MAHIVTHCPIFPRADGSIDMSHITSSFGTTNQTTNRTRFATHPRQPMIAAIYHGLKPKANQHAAIKAAPAAPGGTAAKRPSIFEIAATHSARGVWLVRKRHLTTFSCCPQIQLSVMPWERPERKITA
jgi:hypothetical protein